MRAKLQSAIADFLHNRGVTGGDAFAVDAAGDLGNIAVQVEWTQQNIRAALDRVSTDIFRRNSQVRKGKLLDELATHLMKRASPPADTQATRKKTCTVLFLAANPSTTTRLQIDEEIRSVRQKIAASKHGNLLRLELAMAARPDDILQRLNEMEPDVLHFSGHGSPTGGITLSGESGTATFLSGRAVDLLFRAMKGRIRLVILNACFTEPQAERIVRYIDCVVGMRWSITDEAAALFAASFYRAIAFGRSVQNAHDQALARVAMEGLDEDETPVLLTRRGVSADSVVLVADA